MVYGFLRYSFAAHFLPGSSANPRCPVVSKLRTLIPEDRVFAITPLPL